MQTIPSHLEYTSDCTRFGYYRFGMSYYVTITKDAAKCEYYIGLRREGGPDMDMEPTGLLSVKCMYDHDVFSVFFSKDSLIRDVLDKAAIVVVAC